MKKWTLGLVPVLLLGASLPFLLQKPVETEASTSGEYARAALPTTINLNPVSEEEIRDYYGDLLGHQYQGTDLLKALKPILKNGQQYHCYDSTKATTNDIWRAYEITDRDWTLSPAGSDSNGSFDPTTGIWSNYSYHEISENNGPWLHLLYRNPGKVNSSLRAWDAHSGSNAFNREHVWAKGHGFNYDDDLNATGARGDLHHLIAGDAYVNQTPHNAYSYGFVDLDQISIDAGTAHPINDENVLSGNYRGRALNVSSTREVFEPQDCDKGDIARACFYMAARYNYFEKNGDPITYENPNLLLTDVLANSSESFTSTAEQPGEYGILRDLLAWHHLDPVDEYEIHRNDILHRNFTKNRNPFIDFPEWVDYVWGTSTLDEDGRTIIERDETPTGYADPSKDVVYGYSEDPVDPPTPIEEPEEQADVWTKAVSLSDGDEICFVNESAGYAMSDLASGKAFATVESTAGKLSDHCLSEELGHTFSVEASDNGTFHLKYSDGLYLSYSTSSPYLGTAASGNINWTLTNLDGAPLIQNTANASRWLGYNYNSGNPRFGLYANTTNYPCPSVYIKGVCNAASGYGERFSSEWTSGCKESGTYDGDKMDWEAATSAYNALSTRTQQFLTAASKDNPYVGDALAKYDYIVGKYGVDLFPDFLGRNPVRISGALKVSQAHVSGSYIVILAILGGGAALATLLLVLSKRRRHQA